MKAQVPKPIAAPTASNNDFGATPLENSGPLHKKPPTIARAEPIALPVLIDSPPTIAIVIGMITDKELIGDTTPIFPVERPAYRQIKPKYPHKPAAAPAKNIFDVR
jgi:hypothetical protein